MESRLTECPWILAASDSDMVVPVILGVIALVAVIAVVSWLAGKKRTEQFSQAARRLNLPFFPEGDASLIIRLDQFHLFSRGRSQKIRNMMHGESNGVELAIFDYRYTIGHGKNARTYHQSVIYFRSPMLTLTPFEMRPEGFFHKIGSLFGYQDIDFKSHPQFSKNYLLRGEDEPRVRELFTADKLSFFESQKKICVEGGGDQLVFYRQKSKINPDKSREFMQEGLRIFALFRGA